MVVGDRSMSRLCQLSTGAHVSPVVVEPYLGHADVQGFVDDARHVLGVSPARTFRGWMRRAVEVRDRQCQHPCGCDAPITHCDVDHIVPSACGGPTSLDNGRLLCATHNRHRHLHDQSRPPPV